jgi:hypothetical protein
MRSSRLAMAASGSPVPQVRTGGGTASLELPLPALWLGVDSQEPGCSIPAMR